MSEHDISDELLTAFLDGELAAEDHTRVEAAVADDPKLQARLSELDIPMAPLRDGFASMLTQAPDTLLPPGAPTKDVRFPTVIAGCALAAGITVGAFGLSLFSSPASPASPGWMDYVASYQALYSTQTLESVSQTPGQKADQLTIVSDAVGRPLAQAQTLPGMKFKRAQVLGFRGKPLVQLAYLTPDGVPMALCIIAKAESKELNLIELEDMQSAAWSDGTHAYLLIGGDDPELVKNAAEYLQTTL